MRSWRLAAGMLSGAYATAPVVTPEYGTTTATFESSIPTEFVGDWVLSSEWAAAGTYSLGRSNKGVASSTSTTVFTKTFDTKVLIEFDFFVQGEGSADPMTILVNGVGCALADIGLTATTSDMSFADGVIGSRTGYTGRFSKLFDPGTVAITLKFTKDGSVDVGLDGGFVDNFAYTTYAPVTITPPAGATYFQSFESDTSGWTGDWVRTTKWVKSGVYSLGPGNRGKASSSSTASFSKDVSVATTLAFDFFLQSEVSADLGVLTIGGKAIDLSHVTWANTNAYTQAADGSLSSSAGVTGHYSRTFPAGTITLTAKYTKDLSADTGLDGLFIDDVTLTPYSTAAPSGSSYYADFSASIPAEFTGSWARSAVWSSVGPYALANTNQGQTSTSQIETFTTTLGAASKLTFDFYVQSESGGDGLIVSVNGTAWTSASFTTSDTYSINGNGMVSSPSGAVGHASISLPAGANTVTFTYYKDTSTDVGLDSAFISNFAITPIVNTISLRAVGTEVMTNSLSSVDVVAPTCAAGDLLVCTMLSRGTVTPPTGWTLVDTMEFTAISITQQTRVYTKTAGAADSGATFSFGNTSAGRLHAQIAAYTGSIATPAVITTVKGEGGSGYAAPVLQPTAIQQMALMAGSWVDVATGIDTTSCDVSGGGWVQDSIVTSGDTSNQTRLYSGHTQRGATTLATAGTWDIHNTNTTDIGAIGTLLG